SRPFSFQKRHHLVAPMDELRPVSPVGIRSIAARDSLWIARIPIVFHEPNFQNRGLPRKRRNQAWCWFGLRAHFSSSNLEKSIPRLWSPALRLLLCSAANPAEGHAALLDTPGCYTKPRPFLARLPTQES